jgi:hypothetical protein
MIVNIRKQLRMKQSLDKDAMRYEKKKAARTKREKFSVVFTFKNKFRSFSLCFGEENFL